MLSDKAKTGDHSKPYLGNSNVHWGRFNLTALSEMDFLPHERKKFALKDGDILVCEGGEVGRTAIWQSDLAECYYQKALHRLRPLSNSADRLFFRYFMEDACRKNLFLAYTGTSSIPHLTRETLVQLKMPLPPPPEQQKIAAILSTWDRAIELTEKLIAAKQKRKQALMQQLLTGKVRLPEFQAGKKNSCSTVVRVPAAVRRGIYPPSVQPGIPKITHRPKGWQELTMGHLLEIEQRSIELSDEVEYQLVVAKRNRGGIEPRERLLGKDVKTPTQFEVRAGDFVISKRQIIHGACGIVPPSLDGAVVSNEYSVCTVKAQLNMEFLKYLSHTLYFQQTCFHASVGVALEKMIFRVHEWIKFPFLIPSIEEQRAIVAVLSTMDRELEILQKRLAVHTQQKKGLMQQLLTGKIRVKVELDVAQAPVAVASSRRGI